MKFKVNFFEKEELGAASIIRRTYDVINIESLEDLRDLFNEHSSGWVMRMDFDKSPEHEGIVDGYIDVGPLPCKTY
ncbi:MAG: hypothetical protein VW518_05835 [Burkholderiaceae bacterium]